MDSLARTVPAHFGSSDNIVFLSTYRIGGSAESAVVGQVFFHNGNCLCAAIALIKHKYVDKHHLNVYSRIGNVVFYFSKWEFANYISLHIYR